MNEAFARRFWGDAPPVGRTIRIGGKDAQHETRVIGVAADIREMGLDRAAKATVLVPHAQGGEGAPLLLVRVASSALLSTLRNEITAEAPRLAPELEGLAAVVSRSVAAPRFRTVLVAAFAGFALLLAGIGIYAARGSPAGVQRQPGRRLGGPAPTVLS